MKTKTYLRYISCVLAVLLCVASIMPIAFADSTNHGNSESLLLLNSLQFVMEVSHELRVRCILMM